MKTLFKRMSAGLLALFVVISLLPATLPAAKAATGTGYTSASDVQYVKNGQYVANWGARGEVCVFLSSYAQNFYTGSNTFETLSQLTGGSSQSNAPQSALYSALKSFMTSKHSNQTSYNATRSLFCYTDCVLSNYSKISSFYSGKTLSGTWDGGSTWNREHTWPNSKGLGGNDENDIMMLRPTSVSENSSRGNTAYGESGSYYKPDSENPPASVKGDVARIMLYVYVRWGNTGKMWGQSGVMENMNILLKWMKEDPVDTWEMGRNDAVQSITGTRNVFVDYPEFAWLLFGQDVPSGISTPSDNDGVTANPGGNTGSGGSSSGGNSGSTTDTSYTQVSTLNDGDKVLIVNPASGMALSMNKVATHYNAGVDISGGFGSITDSEIFTVKKNTDGSYSFTSASGKKLAMGDSFTSMNETGTNDKWTLSSAGSNQFYLLNAGRGLYLEWYASKGNWSAYNPGSPSSLNQDYALAFYVKTTAGSNPTPPTTNPPATQPPATNPPATNPPATNPPATQGSGSTTTPPATQPSQDTTTPPASQPGTSEGTQTSSPATQPGQSGQPGQPAPLPMASVNPDDYFVKDDSSKNTIIVVVAALAVALIGGGVAVYFFVIKPKKNIAPAAMDISEEIPTEENPEDPTENNE